jgi:hypothetical protein
MRELSRRISDHSYFCLKNFVFILYNNLTSVNWTEMHKNGAFQLSESGKMAKRLNGKMAKRLKDNCLLAFLPSCPLAALIHNSVSIYQSQDKVVLIILCPLALLPSSLPNSKFRLKFRPTAEIKLINLHRWNNHP